MAHAVVERLYAGAAVPLNGLSINERIAGPVALGQTAVLLDSLSKEPQMILPGVSVGLMGELSDTKRSTVSNACVHRSLIRTMRGSGDTGHAAMHGSMSSYAEEVVRPVEQDANRDGELERLLSMPSAGGTADPIPVTVLTGFLGAGKTTLIIESCPRSMAFESRSWSMISGRSTSTRLIVGVAAPKVSLANGCVCCEVRDDLLAAIDALLWRTLTSTPPVGGQWGCRADDVARTFVDAAYQGRLRLDGIIAVVDAEQLPAQVADPVTSDLVYAQIGCSDLVLLNKIDLADRQRVDAVRAFVCERLDGVRLLETVQAGVPTSVLFFGARPESQISLDEPDDHGHQTRFVSWVYRRELPFGKNPCGTASRISPARSIASRASSAPPNIRSITYRASGRHRSDITPFNRAGAADPLSALVIIADKAVDRAAVDAALDTC